MVTRKIGKYDIVERLGRGGMAEVYRAYHASLDRYVAIKVLHAFLADDPEFKTRFEREARNVARLKHPNIVQVYDFDYDEPSESYYMVMELVEGPTLKERLQAMAERGGLLPLDESLRIIREAAGALAYAHSRDMIHRDVKPANLMLDHDERVVLTDFGIAKIVTGAQFTASGGMVGTPAYMAPEQGLGEAGDERSDLYSLGIILFQLVTGRLPYDAETPLAIVLKHLQTPTPSARTFNPQVPEAVDRIISKAIAKEVQNRYQSATELIEDLERAQRGEPVYTANGGTGGLLQTGDQDTVKVTLLDDTPTQNLTPVVNPPLRKRRSWLGWAGAAAVVLVALAFAGAAGGLFSGVWPGATRTPTAQNVVALPSAEATESAGVVVVPPPTQTPSDTPTTPAPSPTRQPTNRPSDTAAPTVMPSRTSRPTDTPTSLPTRTPTSTPSATLTRTPTATPTPTLTYTPTPNTSATAAVVAAIQTATATACIFNYEIVEQNPEDNGLFPANRDYARKITLRNTGTCAWEPNTSLFFVRGENFRAGSFIRIEKPVSVGETVVLDFVGKTPARGAEYSGIWELRTPNNQRRIGEPMEISVTVYEGGG
ncbi:MAG: protein kinase [Chloroflexi bacterium]|nr:protein kinase [Chloroflexota bacterium]